MDAEVFKDGPRLVTKDARAEDEDDHDRAVHPPLCCVDSAEKVRDGLLENGILNDDDWGGEGGRVSVKGKGRSALETNER